ncbi:MAG: 1,4-alpha-glucan branching protein GlgB [Acidimicrobiales bacterium]|nr:1,4-alpha-glucan branching protein GlgB [Acidimicrobiales bacterium]
MFNEGSHVRLYEVLGCQPLTAWSDPGRRFAVWAPSARSVAVSGDFTQWDGAASLQLEPQASSGIWAGVVPNAKVGDRYKFRIETEQGFVVERADPLAFAAELPPHTASVVTDLSYDWSDAAWMKDRSVTQRFDKPISIYEMHAGSWRHAEAYRSLTWSELAEPLSDYLTETGFTHVELLPIMEYPFYGSWGYQTTGFYAPTARFGLPTDFMGFVDALHQRGIGVILDWVPSHFPSDDFALGRFDGTPLYEHGNPMEGWHPDWKSYVFNYGRHEVRSFLTSSAHMWMDRYHVDGIRVDAVASMLYRDYSREEGEWIPNVHGGRENLEAIGFLQQLNQSLGERFPDAITVAEESTAFPGVTRPVSSGGLGFDYKWDMGWMHDTLQYLERDPIHRRYHHNEITFRSMYAFSEHYVLGLSHDEVTHGKGSLVAKMPGDPWQQFANLRLLYGNQWMNPGKKLLFMGQEFGQGPEWNHDHPVAWSQLELPEHSGIQKWVAALNQLYASEAALHATDTLAEGFSWVVLDDGENSVLAWLREADGERPVLCVLNLTPIPREGYRLGVPQAGTWELLANSDAEIFGGTGALAEARWEADGHGAHGRAQSLVIDIPPLGAVALAPVKTT